MSLAQLALALLVTGVASTRPSNGVSIHTWHGKKMRELGIERPSSHAPSKHLSAKPAAVTPRDTVVMVSSGGAAVLAEREPEEVDDSDGAAAHAGNTSADDVQVSGASVDIKGEIQKRVEAGKRMQTWTKQKVGVAVGIGILWLVYPLVLYVLWVHQGSFNGVRLTDIQVWGGYPSFDLEQDEADRISWRRRILMAEVLVNGMQPFIVAIVYGFATLIFKYEFSTSPPLVAQLLIFVPPVIRAIRIETTLANKSAWQFIKEDFTIPRFPPAPFLRTKGEVIDATTDGISIVIVFMMQYHNPIFDTRLNILFASDPVGWLLAPLSSLLGLSGLLVIIMLIATLMQVTAVRVTIEDDGWLAADSAGFGGLAEQIRPQCPDDSALELKHLGRSLYEGVPQLIIQTVALIAAGQGMLRQPVLMTSMTVGFLLLIWRSSVLVRIGLRKRGVAALLGGLVMLALVVIIVFRLAISEFCQTLMFDLVRMECVAAPMPHVAKRSVPELMEQLRQRLGGF